MSLEDRHVPDPTHPFGIGSVSPISGQAGNISRNHRLMDSPDTASELPRTHVFVQGQEVRCAGAASQGCLTANFRSEPIIEIADGARESDAQRVDPGENIQKYQEVYGFGNVDAASGRVIDSCEGELLDHGSCVRQARLILDQAYCTQECVRGRPPGSGTTCPAVCAQSVSAPWYAAGGHRSGSRWVFPVLDRLFAFGGVTKSMGIQPGQEAETSMTSTLNRTEGTGSVTTNSTADWATETTRSFKYKPAGDTSGNAAERSVATTAPSSAPATTTWSTSW
jgi:hypothetical protein